MLGNHLLGLYEKALPPELTWEERLRAVTELGFDYLEISVDEKDERLARLDWTQAERGVLHRAMRETGVPIQSMCLSGHRRFPYGSADPAVRARAHEITEKAVLFAREFGIRVIQLAGYDVYYEPSTPESLRITSILSFFPVNFCFGLNPYCGISPREINGSLSPFLR